MSRGVFLLGLLRVKAIWVGVVLFRLSCRLV